MFRNILIADSDIESRDRMYEILTSMGHKVECAPNNNEVLAMLQRERAHLLVLDENLAPDGGLKAMERIRKFDQHMKVVFLTKEKPSVEIEALACGLGACVAVQKDFSDNIMIKKIIEIAGEIHESVQEGKYADLGRILIVDDSSEIRAALSIFLKMRGFDVAEAPNGDQALMEIKVQRPALVLLDERMPGMDGLMALKKIKELDLSIKVVMLSAVEDEDIVKEAKRLGACDYVTKPFDLKKMEAFLISILIPEEYRQNS